LKQKTITIIGFGNIGRFICAQLLPYKQSALKINLIDPDEDVEGAILDFRHGLEFFPEHEIHFNDQQLFNDSDLIFHCAGASVPKGQSRMTICADSIAISESVYRDYQAKDSAFIIVVANPVEIIASVSQKLTGLKPNQIIGVGTYLDSIRMNYLIKADNSNFKAVNAVVIGEHGSTAFLANSLSSINGQKFEELFNEGQLQKLVTKMKSAAEEIKATQSATIYGVGYCAMKLFYALMGEKELKVAASVPLPNYLKDDLGEADIYLSLYSKINENGIQAIESDYSKDELERLKMSYDLVVSCIPENYLTRT
jgi:L-lactate dehydrogenase